MKKQFLKITFVISTVFLSLAVAFVSAYPFIDDVSDFTDRILFQGEFIRGEAGENAEYSYIDIPDDISILDGKAAELRQLISNQELSDSINLLTEQIENYPHDFRYYVWRANLRSRSNDDMSAISDYIMALEIVPDTEKGVIYEGLGLSYFRLNNYENAWNSFLEAENYGRHFKWVSTHNRAFMCYWLGAYECAINYFSNAIPQLLVPTHKNYFFYRAYSWKQVGNIDNAIIDYTTSIGLFPEGNASYLNRGTLYWEVGLYDQAIQDYRKCIEKCNSDIVKAMAANKLKSIFE